MIPAWISQIGADCVVPLDHARTGQTASLLVDRDKIENACQVLWDQGYHIESLAACDVLEGFVVRYHFAHWTEPGRLTLRVSVPRDDARIPTVSKILPGADWHERECHDFHGVVFTGHPNLHALLLPDDGTPPPLVKSNKARKSRTDVLPLEYLVDCGLPPETQASDKPASGDAGAQAKG
jgi:NADH-quinone oxidoreductase subunit C